MEEVFIFPTPVHDEVLATQTAKGISAALSVLRSRKAELKKEAKARKRALKLFIRRRNHKIFLDMLESMADTSDAFLEEHKVIWKTTVGKGAGPHMGRLPNPPLNGSMPQFMK